MVAAIRDSADWSTEQAAAQRQLMVRRLPRFAVCWLATTVLWNLILVVEGHPIMGVAGPATTRMRCQRTVAASQHTAKRGSRRTMS